MEHIVIFQLFAHAVTFTENRQVMRFADLHFTAQMRENAPASPKQKHRNAEYRENQYKYYPGNFVAGIAAAVYYIYNRHHTGNLRKLVYECEFSAYIVQSQKEK